LIVLHIRDRKIIGEIFFIKVGMYRVVTTTGK
jgi:hypothetical protein